MKSPFLRLALSCLVSVTALADTPPTAPDVVTAKDLVPDIKLVVRSVNGAKLTDEETARVNIMIAYLKGYTDGIQPIQKLFPMGPTLIPESVTIGEFAKRLDDYMDRRAENLNVPTASLLFDFAVQVYHNPNFNPATIPRTTTVPLPAPTKP